MDGELRMMKRIMLRPTRIVDHGQGVAGIETGASGKRKRLYGLTALGLIPLLRSCPVVRTHRTSIVLRFQTLNTTSGGAGWLDNAANFFREVAMWKSAHRLLIPRTLYWTWTSG